MAADGFGAIDPQELAQAASAVKDQVVEAVQRARERLEVDRRIQESPWLVLGLAAGAGFVLGGGLWPALRPIVRSAARAALSPANLLAAAAALGAMKATQREADAEAGPEVEPPPTAH